MTGEKLIALLQKLPRLDLPVGLERKHDGMFLEIEPENIALIPQEELAWLQDKDKGTDVISLGTF